MAAKRASQAKGRKSGKRSKATRKVSKSSPRRAPRSMGRVGDPWNPDAIGIT